MVVLARWAALVALALVGCLRSNEFVTLPAESGRSWVIGQGPPGNAAQIVMAGGTDRPVELLLHGNRQTVLELLAYDQPIEALGLEPGSVASGRCGRSCALLRPDRVFRLDASALDDGWTEHDKSGASPALLSYLVPDRQRCPFCSTFETRLVPLGTTAMTNFVSPEADGRAVIGFWDGSIIRFSTSGEIERVCGPGAMEATAGLREDGGDIVWLADHLRHRLGFLRLSAQSSDRPCTLETSTAAPTTGTIERLAGRIDPADPEIYALTDLGELRLLSSSGWRAVAEIEARTGVPSTIGERRRPLKYFDSNNVLAASGGEVLWERRDGVEQKIVIRVPARLAFIESIDADPGGIVLGLDDFGLAHYRHQPEPELLVYERGYENPTAILRKSDRWLVFLDSRKLVELIDGQPACPKLEAPNDHEPYAASWLADGTAIAIDAESRGGIDGQRAVLVRPIGDAPCTIAP